MRSLATPWPKIKHQELNRQLRQLTTNYVFLILAEQKVDWNKLENVLLDVFSVHTATAISKFFKNVNQRAYFTIWLSEN